MEISKQLAATVVAVLMLSGASHAQPLCNDRCLAEKALGGDGSAALQLANNSLHKNHEHMVYWYGIAAENGHKTGQWNYAMWLVADSKSRGHCVRALYWFKQARLSGHPLADDAVKTLTAALSKSDALPKGCPRAL